MVGADSDGPLAQVGCQVIRLRYLGEVGHRAIASGLGSRVATRHGLLHLHRINGCPRLRNGFPAAPAGAFVPSLLQPAHHPAYI